MSSTPPELSFEFFPPRSPDAEARLESTITNLAGLQPAFFSVTFGAGGSTRDKTFETVIKIRQQTGLTAVPHISCIGFPLQDIRDVLQRYQDNDFTSLVVLRGDMPSGTAGIGPLRYANELVDYIRKETGDYFKIYVACYPEVHPQAQSVSQDLQNFKRKVDAGADAAITQYFYNADSYYRFLESCAELDISVPVIPGIMPITNCNQLVRFSEGCGAEIPRWILKRLYEFGDDRKSIRAFGVDVTTRLCEQLLQSGAPGLHIYTMNQHEATLAIWKNLNLSTAQQA